MGMFDVHCVVSDLPLRGEAVLVPLLHWHGTWVPSGLWVEGDYNRYGGLESNWWADPVTEKLMSEAGMTTLEPSVWRGAPYSYALFDAGVFHALAQSQVAAQLPTLGRLGLPELLVRALVIPSVRARYRNDRDLGPVCLELLCAMASGIEWRPLHLHDFGQYGSIDQASRLDDEDGVLPLIEAARIRYQDDPHLLAAVAQSARTWSDDDELPPTLRWVADVVPPPQFNFTTRAMVRRPRGTPAPFRPKLEPSPDVLVGRIALSRTFAGERLVSFGGLGLAAVGELVERLGQGSREVVVVDEAKRVRFVRGDQASFESGYDEVTVSLDDATLAELAAALRAGSDQRYVRVGALPELAFGS